ncbi:hypothetical protein [Erwinia sp. JH02]|uniref:hypothetical protein n=1 Tax=Erwinia sp. JH02 TaxID=2733394 RepID=UPI001488EF4C|nr:hypothetical protein [Erwinia sp. JH02]NNS07327.1 hypothetical protein [Erwinia sp. JH02]
MQSNISLDQKSFGREKWSVLKMRKVIGCWLVDVFTQNIVCNGGEGIKGYQRVPEPEFNNGFLILRDKSGVQLKALNTSGIAGFNITPIYADEK